MFDESDDDTPPLLTPSITAQGIAIHLLYDQNFPPPLPGPEWTRFICLSDTHCQTFKVPDGDVLLHSGDLTSFGRTNQIKKTMDWLCSLPHKTKVIIAGNHDLSLDKSWYLDQGGWESFHSRPEDADESKELMSGEKARDANVIYLEYSSTEIQPKSGGRKWKIYGSPGSPWFGGWGFNYDRGGEEAKAIYNAVPNDVDILLTHGPPFRILDRVLGGDRVGCEDLWVRLQELKPKLHVFGHIHEDRGAQIHEWTQENRTIFVNAANMPLGWKWRQLDKKAHKRAGGIGNQPVIVDLLDELTD